MSGTLVDDDLRRRLLRTTGAASVRGARELQPLWSGYGSLLRVALEGGSHPSVIVKRVRFPARVEHPRGRHGASGDARKRRSYAVEGRFYDTRVRERRGGWTVPAPLAVESSADGPTLILEDLGARFPHLASGLDERSVLPCLDWLAAFHAEHLGDAAGDLWPRGCYWDLSTRAEELRAMPDGPHRRHARSLADALDGARHRTLVHGDAKVANFLFDGARRRVAAVDFQYVGGGPGIRDVAYLFGSCLSVDVLEAHAEALLDRYGRSLEAALATLRPEVEARGVVREWRALYPIAWADFERFLLGWAPGHPKLTRYGAALSRRAFATLTSSR